MDWMTGRWQDPKTDARKLPGICCTTPYLIAAYSPMPAGASLPTNGLSGLELLVRENIVRYIKPFDLKDPFYIYLYQLPRILIPWSLVFIAAALYSVAHNKKLEPKIGRYWKRSL